MNESSSCPGLLNLRNGGCSRAGTAHLHHFFIGNGGIGKSRPVSTRSDAFLAVRGNPHMSISIGSFAPKSNNIRIFLLKS